MTTALTFAQGRKDSGPPTLRLETHLLTGRFCSGDNEVATYLLRLRLRYTNTSEVPIILYKGSSVVTTLTISRSAEEAISEQHELRSPITIFQMTTRPLSEKSRLDNRFAVLGKGASFDAFVEVAVPFARQGNALPGTVAVGEHVLQIEVSTWPGSAELAESLGKRWRHRGYLWSEVTESLPMRFHIDKQVKTRKCP